MIKDLAELRRRFGGILQAFTPQADIYILGRYATGLQSQVDKEYPGCNIRLIEADHKGEQDADYQGNLPFHSYWIQDPFVVMESACGLVFLEPYYYERMDDRWVAEQLSSQTDALIKSTPLEIQGGNILIGDDYALVGPDLVEAAIDRAGDREKALKLWAQTLGVNRVGSPYLTAKAPTGGIVNVGDTGFQPLYHLDLYVTLGGINRDGAEVVFVAELPRWLVVEKHNSHPALLSLSEGLDQTETWFTSQAPKETGRRWKVYRLPIVPCLSKDREGKPRFFFLSFNNSHVEHYGDVRRVYLPKYHSNDASLLDDRSAEHEAVDAFDRAGFKATWVDNGFLQKATRLGALHCISSILKRL